MPSLTTNPHPRSRTERALWCLQWGQARMGLLGTQHPHLSVVELHGVVGGERNMQSLVQEFPQRVFGIFKEQAVVAKRRHGNGDLSKVVEILQHRTLQKNHHTQLTSAREGREEGRTGNQGSGECLCNSLTKPEFPKARAPRPPPPLRSSHPPHAPLFLGRPLPV